MTTTNAALSLSDLPAQTLAANSLRVRLQCPVCRHDLDTTRGDTACRSCGFLIAQTDGIYRALSPVERQRFARFITEYQIVREKEGRGSNSAQYYLALPFEDLTGRNSWQWAIRKRTFLHFENKILPRIAAEHPHGADILDLGAGNGWLSYRLALKGHHPLALDLADNCSDGLGAAANYFSQLPAPFPCFQAQMDRLPFAAHQFDAVIFNASFHYSVDYFETLKEVLRCLRRPGYVIIADSPLYRRSSSGEQMVKERRADFQRRFGFPSDGIASQEFLTPGVLAKLAECLALRWHIEKPWYGLGWAMRPLKAAIRRRREPSKFYLIWARVEV